MAPLEGDTFCAPQKNGIRGSILLGTITFYPFTAKVLLCCFAVVPLSAYLNDSCQRLTFDISFCNCTCPLFQIRYMVPGIRRILFEISWHTYNTSLAREATVATRWTTIRASPTACKVQGVLQTRQCLKKYPVKFGAVPYHTTAMYCTHYVITYGRSSFSAGRMKIFSAISRFRSRCATRFVQGSFPLWTARYVWFHWRHPNRVEKIRL